MVALRRSAAHAILGGLLLLVVLTAGLLAGCCESSDYGEWLAEHRKTCPRCGHPESTLCDGAFIELQIHLRQYEAVPQIDKAKAFRRWRLNDLP